MVDVCAVDCDSEPTIVSVNGCKARKYLHGCAGPAGNTLLQQHDQDCSNYLGFGGLLDGTCVGGKSGTKGGEAVHQTLQWVVPVIIGGVVIFMLLSVM